SWVNPAHPGYVYPEGMGLYLTLMAQLTGSEHPEVIDPTHRVARALQELVSPLGGIGIQGKLFSFDTCMAITGLLSYRRRLNGEVNAATIARMGGFVVGMAERRLAVVNDTGSVPDVVPHWSTAFGASMLKEVIALDALATETGDERCRALAIEIADEVIAGCRSDGFFHVIPQDRSVYSHAHCYALEGLLHLRARGYRDATEMLREGADRLCEWQNEDGSLFNWNNTPPTRERRKVGDACAQAVRIWLAVDRDAYRPQIERGVSFLASLASPIGGLTYCLGSGDINSITSIFAVQAIEWYLHEPRPDQIV
ncbi:MAG: hypothetical protein ACRDG4_09900, partial [Chloroflexota bacterium]